MTKIIDLIPDPYDQSVLGGIVNRASRFGYRDFSVHSYEMTHAWGRRYELRARNSDVLLAVADVPIDTYLNQRYVKPDTHTFVPDWQYSDLLCLL